MSLPLTRRIAKAALLTAAGAASVVGAAGSASAADLPTSDLGGLSNLDTPSVNDAVGDTAQTGASLAGEVGDSALQNGLPTTGGALEPVAEAATPVAEQAAQDTVSNGTTMLGDTAQGAAEELPETDLPNVDRFGNNLTPGDLLA